MIFLSFFLSLFFFFLFLLLFFFFLICETYKRQKYMSWRHYEDVSDNIAPGYVKLFLIARFMPCCAPVWMRSARERFLTWRYVEKDYTKDVSEEIAARGNSCILYVSCHYIKQIKGLGWYKRFLIRFDLWRDNRNVIKKIRKKTRSAKNITNSKISFSSK